ncbi:hypothetical protein Sj15T_25970 [Sphingobium sp. TA15]|uniref:Uncharacterized protein n=1 Tax=Sphingobium indicum (strain DSM 16413 / CCM 7287 / MTCC 6362 / UT26 / NBRC 101211 / UT26S) TaxID=452662 RepID=D4Z6G9_SPHIU|nr:hypothetical protein SJA_C1-33670 [Sphingobium indicum UT26S]BDD67576.1 hypothetical protein Sj15T_25970 [Sphingobium sp. TA15]
MRPPLTGHGLTATLAGALLLLASAPVDAAPRKGVSEETVKPDFSSIETAGAAKALAAQGRLVRVLLFPAEVGGRAVRENMIYITPEAAAARELVIGTLVRLISEGSVDKMEVTPAYKGRSLVPAAITLRAWHSSKAGSFEPTIQIW